MKRKFPIISQFDFLPLTDMIFTMLNYKQPFLTLEIDPVGKNRFLLLFCGFEEGLMVGLLLFALGFYLRNKKLCLASLNSVYI